MKSPAWRGLATGLVLFLAACSGDERPPPCPPVVRVPDATSLTKFIGEGRDLTDVEYQAQLTDILFACEYDDDAIETEMTLTFLADEGPAYKGEPAPLRYFVAVATNDQRVLAREQFQLDLVFRGNQRRIMITDELDSNIPLRAGQNGLDFRVFIGFELTPDQFQYNKDIR